MKDLKYHLLTAGGCNELLKQVSKVCGDTSRALLWY